MSTPIDLAALRALDERTTRPPWHGLANAVSAGADNFLDADVLVCQGQQYDDWATMRSDMALIAAMRNALPALLDRLDAAEAVVEAARNVADAWPRGGPFCETGSTLSRLHYAVEEHDRAIAGQQKQEGT